jgi:hypothetical protein
MKNRNYENLTNIEACVECHMTEYIELLRTMYKKYFIENEYTPEKYILLTKDVAKSINSIMDYMERNLNNIYKDLALSEENEKN